MAVNRATYLEQEEDAAVAAIASERKWSISQTIAELLRESPTFRETRTKLSKTKKSSPRDVRGAPPD